MEYRFIGVHTFKSVLFSLALGVIPLVVYYFFWESLDLRQEIHYNVLFKRLVPVTILSALVFFSVGFYASLQFVQVLADDKHCTIRVSNPLMFFLSRKITFRWDEVDSLILDEDLGKTTLTVYLRGARTFQLSYSLLLRGNSDFRAFVSILGLNTGL
jgi:hypothetical protein